MCGLIGHFTLPGMEPADLGPGLARMRRRGPDGEGWWEGPGARLGHRRLAVLDLDPRSDQPMVSACGRYVIVLNGEIYNFRELRREFEARGRPFRTTSDTEVVLEGFACLGEALLPRLRGMFAFAIWDRLAAKAFLARDPYGIKPLYYSASPSGLMVASQVKALLATVGVSKESDPHGQASFWMLGSVAEPATWYRHIRALPAGHCAWVEGGRLSRTVPWHDIGEAWRGTHGAPAGEAPRAVREALRESVASHLVSDVPVGVFLSGGIDSGSLVGLMVEAGARHLEGVTVAFAEFAQREADETPVAAGIAAHFGIRHHVRRVTREEFQADLPRILEAMDQPSIDGINTWYASKAAAELGFKVVVSGLGGDELFQGYPSFRQLPKLLAWRRRLGRVPGAGPALALWGRLRAQVSGNDRWRHLAAWTQTLEGVWWLRRSLYAPGDLGPLVGFAMEEANLSEFDPVSWLKAACGELPADPLLALGQIESMTYLRNQLLRDSDWASMDHSVELRTPLVDAHLLHQVRPWLPVFGQFPGKSLLAQAVANPMPWNILGRPKVGFGIPLGFWLPDADPASEGRTSRVWARQVAEAFRGSAE